MPPKAQNARGVRRKVAPEEAPIMPPTKKRGRPAKTNVKHAVQDATESPRKRGRPAKSATEDASGLTKRGRGLKLDALELAVPTTTTTPNKGRGRPKKYTEVTKESSKPPQRPRKEVVAEPAQTPRRRGRPPKAHGLDLNAVAGSPRVSKRSSAQSKTTAPGNVAARPNLRMCTKSRTRPSPAKVSKEEPASQPARRGRPPKNAAKAPVANKAVRRKAAETPDSKPTKPTKPAKPTAPRKMRGHTLRQIPDKFVAQIDQYLHDLMQTDSDFPPAKRDQERKQGQENHVEDEANVEGNDNMEPTSISTGAQDQEEVTQDAGTDFVHAQDGAVDQYSDDVAGDLADSEAALNKSGEQEQDMQSELNGEFTAANDVNEDEIMGPVHKMDMPSVDHEYEADSGQVLKGQEGYVHESLVASSTIITAQ